MNLDSSLRKVAVALYDYLNSPRSLTCTIMLRYGEWSQLAVLAAEPRNYLDTTSGAKAFARDAQASDFLRKSPLLPIQAGSLREAAERTFQECEAQCKVTNDYLNLLALGGAVSDDPLSNRVRSILTSARKIAGRILGKIPDDLPGRFGPGTSAELKGSTYTTVNDKLWTTPHATPSCLALFELDFWRTHWGRWRLGSSLPLPAVTRGNRFTTVPKDATKDRGICVEPLGNLWVQLGIGGYLKRRLGDVGLHVGLSKAPDCPIKRLQTAQPFDGQHFHRQMARVGSSTGEWCTIDLSNASDTLSLELVRWILPPDWFELLYAARSPFTYLNDHWVRLEKFSSMGNGYTFELETLVFAAILAAGLDLKVGRDLFVYGDDILLPNDRGTDAMAMLRACGFTPNARKSFTSGPFRESCGGDYFEGFSVRSCYSDSELTSPLDWFTLHNQLNARWPFARKVRQRIQQCVPTRLRLTGPSWLGDCVFHAPFKARLGRHGIWRLAVVRPITLKVPLDRWSEECHLTAILLGGARASKQYPRGFVSPRSDPLGYRIRTASVS